MQKLKELLKAKGYSEKLALVGPSADYTRFDHHKPNSGYFNLRHIKVGEKTYISAVFGDWSVGEKYTYKSDEPTDPAEREAYAQAFEQDALKESEEKLALQEATAKSAETLWCSVAQPCELHPYLAKKGLTENYGAKVSGTTLMVPCRDIDGKLWGIQKILVDGSKFFTPNQRVKGVMHVIGTPTDGEVICVGEGFATASSIHVSTGLCAVSAFNAGNLQRVCEALHSRFPKSRIVVCADNDQYPNALGKITNPGVHFGGLAALSVQGYLAIPQFTSLDSRPTDFNDLHCLEGADAVKRTILESLESSHQSPAPGGNDVPKSDAGAGDQKDSAKKKEAEEIRRFFEATLRQFNTTYHYKVIGRAKICFVWDKTHYVEMGDQYIRNYAQTNLKPRPEKKKREEFLDRVLISNLIDASWFDSTTSRHINFQNGVLNIDTGVLSAHSPERGFRYVLPFNYEPGAVCPVYDAMMKRVTCGDAELERLLDEYMGYALSFDRIWCHKILVLTGDGENGKSTWLDVLRGLAGPGNYTAKLMRDLENEGHRQGLDGKLFNVSAEVPKRGMFDTSVIKALSSGDPIDVRQIYKRSYTMESRAKLIFACNELPDSLDTTQGFFRRFIIVPFNATFKSGDAGFDPMIKEKLQGELSGIFNRALEGYRRMYKAKGFSHAQASHSALAQYRMDCDTVESWIAENVTIDPLTTPPTHYALSSEVYGEYSEAMKAGNIRALSSVDFGRRLRKIIPDLKDRAKFKTIDGKSTRIMANVTYSRRRDF